MNWTEINQAIEEARRAQQIVDDQTHQILKVVKGRLRNVPTGYKRELLVELKRELTKFNSHTMKWKEES